jgi:hypothetical protein
MNVSSKLYRQNRGKAGGCRIVVRLDIQATPDPYITISLSRLVEYGQAKGIVCGIQA